MNGVKKRHAIVLPLGLSLLVSLCLWTVNVTHMFLFYLPLFLDGEMAKVLNLDIFLLLHLKSRWGWSSSREVSSDKILLKACLGFTGGSVVKDLHPMQETWVWSLDQEDPLEKRVVPTPVFMPRESHGQRSLVGYSPWVTKSWSPLSD